MLAPHGHDAGDSIDDAGRRLMDGIDPDLLDRARSALTGTPGVQSVPTLQLRWIGHRLQGNASIQIADMALSDGEQIVRNAEHRLGQALPNLDGIFIRPVTAPTSNEEAVHDDPTRPHPHG